MVINLCATAAQDVKGEDKELYRLLMRVDDAIHELISYCEKQSKEHVA